ncbi:hypothetical protein HU830_04935 [Lactobacillus sp. DCY120]|uniref:HTH-type transcriptional regulator Rgg C-terminal domain-containing protein n=1 Tax=Bombilactobacillus apium TaxID=2675299 RepID=A0A850R3G7_9LACO|nr:hypothetical protein [Bombilactobacillus apium]NVY96511.1 hypothetical protein [Bombilactobacillus apium]
MYGVVKKKIRESKGLPIKGVYYDICSKTNAIKFEKGERTLAADKFNKVLDNLLITMDEFLWIKNGYQPGVNHYHFYMFKKYWNTNQKSKFEENIKTIESNSINIERVQLSSYRLLKEYSQDEKLNSSELAIVIDYFTNLSSWTLSDIRFFANNCCILPYELMLTLLQEALKAQNRYRYFNNSDLIFSTMLSNCINQMINKSDLKLALSFISVLEATSRGIVMAGYQLLVKYYLAKIDFLFRDSSKGHKELVSVLKQAEFLDLQDLAGEIKACLSNKVQRNIV